jgi:hypothetical protein
VTTVFHFLQRRSPRRYRAVKIFADIILIDFWIDGDGLSPVYRQIVPLHRDEMPGAVLLQPGLGSTLLTDEIRALELLVP